ncbi:MAG: hypothetical protein ACIAS6_08375 [Phycisphaerales bacterium JB060]
MTKKFEGRWPFLYDPMSATLSLKRIFSEGQPILYVCHDEEGGYQFLDGGEASEDDAAVVALEEVYALDPTIAEVACLPPGWEAFRERVEDPWRLMLPPDDEQED